MKRLIVTLTAVVSIFGALHLTKNGKCYAQSPVMWQKNGIPIRQGSEIEWIGSTAQMGDDKVLAVWTDTRTGFRAVMAQLYDKNGTVWEKDLFVGEQVYWSEEEDSDSSNSQEDAGIRSQQSDGEPVAVASSDGNVIVAWSKIKGHYGHKQASIVVNKISENGELLWGDGFTLPDGRPYNLSIIADNEGGAYVIWNRHNELCVYGLHLNASGEPFSDGWNREAGLQLTRESFFSFSLCSDGKNGALFIFSYKWSSKDRLTIIRVSPYGEVIWKREMRETNGKSFRTAIVSNTGNDFFGVFYETTEKSQPPKNYLLVIDINGEYVWEKPVLVKEGNSLIERPIQNIGTSDNCFIVSWVEYYYHYDLYPIQIFELYTQKIDLNGNKLWGETGIKVAETENQPSYRLVNDNEGDGAILSWVKKESQSSNRDVFIQRVDANGELVWGKDGIQVTDTPGRSQYCSINLIENDLFVTWSDDRDGSNSLFYQVYDKNIQPLFANNGKLIYQGSSGDVRAISTTRNEDYVYIAWTDTRFGEGNCQIMVQKIDSDGNIYFKENGIPVTTSVNCYKYSFDVVEHHSGGIAITWREGSNIYTQAIGPDGEMLWDPNNDGKGIKISATGYEYADDNPIISRKGEEYFIAWDDNLERSVRAQKIVNGQKMWGDEGVHIARKPDGARVGNYVMQFIDGEYILWYQLRIDETEIGKLYLKRLNTDGTTAEGWDEKGTLIWKFDLQDNTLFNPKAFLTEEGVIIIWEHIVWGHWEYNGYVCNIYAQLVSPEGVIKWEENGKPIADYPNTQSETATFYDGEHIYLAWQDTRNSFTNPDIAVQKIDLDGNLLWGEQAKIITQGNSDNVYPNIAKSENSVLITWNVRYATDSWDDLRMQLVSANTGQSVWDEEGVLLSSFTNRYSSDNIVILDNNEAVVVWSDERSSESEFIEPFSISNIYAQKVNLSSVVSVDEDIAVPQEAMKLYANYPNPFNPDTKISFNLSQNENVSLKVFNIKGQLVKTLLDEEYLENGKHIIVWDGKDNDGEAASSGIYFYRLEGEKGSYTKKMALIK